MLLALLLAAAPLHDLPGLAAQIAAFTGSAPSLDARLQLPACAAPVIAWAGPTHAAAVAECDLPAWRIFVPLRSHAAALPVIRRGDAVVVEVGGAGFRVTIDGIAETDAAAGDRLRVKTLTNGGKLTAIVGNDGILTLPGFSSPAPGR